MNPEPRTGIRRDVIAAAIGVLLIATAIFIGHEIENSEGTLEVSWPPLSALWEPHFGWGTPAAILLAIAVISYGPTVAARLPWKVLTYVAWGASMAWIYSLAMIDGWYQGIGRILHKDNEYLQVIDRFGNIPESLRTFNDYILMDTTNNWPAHVAGHPPGATVTFVWLDRIGLGGGDFGGIFCITLGASIAAAMLVILRALADETVARRAAPFMVLAPAAVWMGTSADAYFAAVTAWAIALLAIAATRTARWPWLAAIGSGLLLGWTCYLSFGLTLFAIMVLTVVLITRTIRPAPWVIAGFIVTPIVFTLLGYNWIEGYLLLTERYVEGAGGTRPYEYWVWANLACTVFLIGVAGVAGIRRSLGAIPGIINRVRSGETTPADRLAMLVIGMLVTVAVANFSGMSKAETERIWLPFAVFLLAATALLPDRGRRYWLAAQAVLPLLVNHLLTTSW